MAIDVHAHLDDEKLRGRYEEIIAGFEGNNVDFCILAGCDYESSLFSVETAKKHDRVYACVGFHPENLDGYSPDAEKRLLQLTDCEKVVAIGEIGLDYHWKPYDEVKQKQAFESQLSRAYELSLPVVNHQRDCGFDVLSSLKRFGGRLPALLHCYSESVEMLKEYLKLNCYVSFGGTLTYKNAKNAVLAAEYAPLDHILTETDSPYLSPQSVRGTVNEPKNVNEVAAFLAEIKKLTKSEVEAEVLANAKRLFTRIKK